MAAASANVKVGASALLFLAVFMVTDGQVTTPATPISCQPIGYNTKNLTRADYWEFTTDKGPCQNGTKCTFYMSLCKKLPDIGAGTMCKDAAVCQKSEASGAYASLGMNGSFVNLTVNEFWALFPKGAEHKTKQNTTCRLASYYVFLCDKNVPWIPVERAAGSSPVASKVPGTPIITYNDRTCTYNVTVRYAGACYQVTPAAAIAVLSAGSVLVILFTVAVVVYCLGGVTYNYCSGAEQRQLVPHAEFWEELPSNIKEGFRFTFTCGQGSSGQKTYEQL
ncbi:uncharacterized protein LOC135483237 [Lineus longissimus]|uniref:uncharacterized protein LOC135483237 n=1 Tax=Lineus longissimus TaxID=88925 RepID=UPI002B4DE12F